MTRGPEPGVPHRVCLLGELLKGRNVLLGDAERDGVVPALALHRFRYLVRVRGVNNYLTEMCSGSEAGSYLRLIDFVYHSTLGLRVIKKKVRGAGNG